MPKNLEKNLDDEEVQIEFPSDIFLGTKTGSIKKTKSEIKGMRIIYSVLIASTLALGAGGLYDSIKTEYGSLGKAYKAQIEKLEKAPARMWNTF